MTAPTSAEAPDSGALLKLTAQIGGISDTVRAQGRRLRRLEHQPITYHPLGSPLGGGTDSTSAPKGTAGTPLILDLGAPPQGCMWSVRNLIVSDATAPVPSLSTTGGYASGVVAAPTAGQAIATLAAANLPKGLYIVRVDAGFGTNPEATTDFNMDLVGNAGAVIKGRLMVTAASNNVRQFVFDQVFMDGASSLQVVAHANASASAVYVADINATLLSPGGFPGVATWWAGKAVGNTTLPVAQALNWIMPTLPAVEDLSAEVFTVKPPDHLLCAVTGLSTGQLVAAHAQVQNYALGDAFSAVPV